tara:strand:- start:3242 stop:3502 length:261 start_codon:yes stop_codon:yes gene_type:complete
MSSNVIGKIKHKKPTNEINLSNAKFALRTFSSMDDVSGFVLDKQDLEKLELVKCFLSDPSERKEFEKIISILKKEEVEFIELEEVY